MTITAHIPLFAVAVILLVGVLAIGHIAVAIVGRPDERDERDRLIEWRAEGNSPWILGSGVIVALSALVLSVEPVWIAHVLLFFLLASEATRFVLQIVYYRRGL